MFLCSTSTFPQLICCETPSWSLPHMSSGCSSNNREWRYVPTSTLWWTFLGICLFLFWRYLWAQASFVYMINFNNLHFIKFFPSHFILPLSHLAYITFQINYCAKSLFQVLFSGKSKSVIYISLSSPTKCLINAFCLILPPLFQQ